jgi:hypothetical protein
MLRFSTLWINHPTVNGNQLPCRTNGISNFENQCAIRMGICLKKSGVLPSQLRGAITCNQAGRTGHTGEDMHYIRANEVANALASASVPGLGPMFKLSNPKDFANEIGGKTGIIYFQDYWYRTTDLLTGRPTGDHIDLWNGWRTTAKILLPWFSWLGGYDRSGQIWFWEVK